MQNFKTDITALADKLESTFEAWAVPYLTAELAAISGLGWLSWPIIAPLFSAALEVVIRRLAQSIEMRSFILHTAIRKAEQAKTYLGAKSIKATLPPTATPLEVYHAEQNELAAFSALVSIKS